MLPTADLNGTIAMAIVVLVLIVVYAIKAKGVGGYLHEWISAPFGSHPLLWIPNAALNLVELLAKPVSLGHAVVRQHVRRRAAVHADRAARDSPPPMRWALPAVPFFARPGG